MLIEVVFPFVCTCAITAELLSSSYLFALKKALLWFLKFYCLMFF